MQIALLIAMNLIDDCIFFLNYTFLLVIDGVPFFFIESFYFKILWIIIGVLSESSKH